MTLPFLEALAARVLVCDGAMGTMLYARGVFLNRCFDELNLTQPELIADVHRDYVRAGADVIETNTFGANRFKLTPFGLADQVRAINVAGATVACRASRGSAYVAGSMGPLGVRLEPWGKTGVDEAEAAFREQAAALAEGGVDLFILETFRDLNEMLAAVRAVRAVARLPIVAQMTTEEDGHSLDGTPVEAFTAALQQAGVDVIGVNCSVGPAAMLETVESIAAITSLPLSAQPNAGRPREVEGRNLYLASPDYMASYARRFVDAGARLVGGCCGTTPEHIRQIALAVRTSAPGARVAPTRRAEGVADPLPGVPRADKSSLARALSRQEPVVLVEVSSPRGLDLDGAVHQARRYRQRGALAVNIPDYPRSSARASALTLALLVERGQVETLLHYCCRDRTLIDMQADLLGAHALGVRNVLLTTGTPASRGTYPDATSVFDVDAIGLVNMASRLNHGLDIGGQPLGSPTAFHVGVAVNPFPPDPEAEWRRLAHKVEAGAEFLVTPPIFDLEAFEAVLPRLQATGLPVIAGLAALEGLRHAEFLASEVPGVRVPSAVLNRLRRGYDEGTEARTLTLELAAWLRSRVAGIQVTTFHGSAATAERLLEELPAPEARPGTAEEARHG